MKLQLRWSHPKHQTKKIMSHKSCILIQSNIDLSGLMEGYKEVGHKLISIQWNSIKDGSMIDNKLTTQFPQTIFDFDLEPQYVFRTDGRRSRHWEQTYMDRTKFNWRYINENIKLRIETSQTILYFDLDRY